MPGVLVILTHQRIYEYYSNHYYYDLSSKHFTQSTLCITIVSLCFPVIITMKNRPNYY